MACPHISKNHITLILCLLLIPFVGAAASNPGASKTLAVATKDAVTNAPGHSGTPTITTAALPVGNMGAHYMGPLSATGGTPPYTWAVVGSGPRRIGLPAGLQLGSGAGSGAEAIVGTPSVIGTYPIIVTVRDHAGRGASRPFSIAITYMPLAMATSSLSPAIVNVPYSATLAANGGLAPYGWSCVSGSLPAGLTMTTAGEISGTPTTMGTSNFVVSVTDSEMPPATVRAPLSITVGTANDIYGGIVSLPSSGGASGFFRLELAVKGDVQREVLVTPMGHYFYMQSVFNASSGFIEPGIMQSRYGGDNNLWATHRGQRMLSWGFNTLGEYTAQTGLPVGTWGGHTGNPVKLPFILLVNAAADLYLNPQRIPNQVDPIKSITAGVPQSTYDGWQGRLLDTYSPQWQAGYAYEIAENNIAITGGFASVPWIVGITLEDADYFWAIKGIGTCANGSPYPHPAFLIATTMFSYTAAQSNLGRAYQDTKLYSKYAWISYLRNKYGTIGALNTAWGSNYTTFDDQGGYGAGTGVLDEDGRHAWMGRDPYNLVGETTALQADMNAFLYQYTYQTFSTGVNAVRNGDNNHLIFGPSAIGGVGNCGIRPQVLHALKDAGVQVLAVNENSLDPNNIGIVDGYYNEAGLPAFIWDTVTAQADSYWHGNPAEFGVPDYQTQPIRGQHYASDQQLFYDATGSDGVHYILGVDFWEMTDSGTGEKSNFGLISDKDNAYDGKCAIVAPSTDPWGYACGGETANYGDFLDAVTQANSTIIQHLISDLSASGGAH
jgi:Putative Ig domain